MNRISIFTVTLCLMFSSLSAQVNLGGSDLMNGVVSKVESEEIKIDLVGSIKAWDQLQAGELDVAIIAYPDDRPPSGEWTSLPFAYQVVSIAVHESNPLKEVSYPQLADAFRDGGRIQEWGSLVPNPSWATKKISVGAIRDRNSLALEIFNSRVMNGVPFRPAVLYSEDAKPLINAIIEDSNFVAVLPGIHNVPLIKTIAVKETDSNQSYTPSADNVMFGDYPLRLAFYVVFRKNLDDSKKRVIFNYLYSEEIKAALVSEDYMPLPDNERRSYLSK